MPQIPRSMIRGRGDIFRRFMTLMCWCAIKETKSNQIKFPWELSNSSILSDYKPFLSYLSLPVLISIAAPIFFFGDILMGHMIFHVSSTSSFSLFPGDIIENMFPVFLYNVITNINSSSSPHPPGRLSVLRGTSIHQWHVLSSNHPHIVLWS